MPLGSRPEMRVEGISTGQSLPGHRPRWIRAYPRGRIAEVFGPESSGKTTLALHVVAEAQKLGGIAAFIDAEHALDPAWAKKLGVQLETLLVSQPNSGEEAMHIAEMLIKSNAVDVIVIDSVAALIPKQELDGEIGDTHVGLQARLMSQTMRKLTGVISKSKAGDHLHQSDSRKDWRHVRQSGDDAGWAGAKILFARSVSTSGGSVSSKRERKSSASACGPKW